MGTLYFVKSLLSSEIRTETKITNMFIFKYEIINEDTDETIVSGSTTMSDTTTYIGENESVDLEVGKALRIFYREKRNKENENRK